MRQISKARFTFQWESNISIDFAKFRKGRASEMHQQIGLHGFIPAPRIELASFDHADVIADDYAGTYYSPELQASYVTEAVDGELVLSEPHASKLPIRAYQSDTFKPLGPTYVGRMKFTRDAVGKVNCVLVSGPLANDIIFRRIELPAN